LRERRPPKLKMARPNPSDETDTIAYAASFLVAAKRLSGPRWQDNHPLVVPFYMLIGFSLENGFKSVLEFHQADRNLKWHNSHNLSRLRRLCAERCMFLDPEQVAFVDELSPMHEEHHFRYPQKAGFAVLLQPGVAIRMTEAILRSAFMKIGGPARVIWEPSDDHLDP
jgi:hypothetical protein